MKLKELAMLSAALLIGLVTHASIGAELDLNDPDDRIRISLKTNCSINDQEPAVYWWEGRVWSRRAGEKDRHLFNVQGMNTRHCQKVEDPLRGLGFKSRSREIMLYLDKETGEVLSTWTNPWTGKEVEVVQVANDPPGPPGMVFWARDENGEPQGSAASYTMVGDFALSGGGAARLFYENPMGGDYQEYVGGWYHAMEFLTGATPVDDPLDGDAATVKDRVLSWGRISKWLPWMEMGDKEGILIFHTAGMRLDSWDQLPDLLKTEIRERFPIYVEPPPIDDPRPKETSWTVTRDYIDAKRREAETD